MPGLGSVFEVFAGSGGKIVCLLGRDICNL